MQINLIYLRFNLKNAKILFLLTLLIGTTIFTISQKNGLINLTFLEKDKCNLETLFWLRKG